MKYIFTITFVIINFNLFSQILVVDELKKQIPYVDIILLDQKAFLWQTDINGKFPLSIVDDIDKNDTLILHHISFKDKKILKKDLEISDSIFLNSKPYHISEIKISAKTPKYQKMLACYRNIKIQNGQPVYYTDGRTNYLSKNKNLKYKLLKIEYRTFENKQLDQFYNDYSVVIPMGYAYIPIPEEKYLPYQFAKKNKLIFVKSDSITVEILTKDSIVIGEICKREDRIEYRINNIFDIKKRKALNTEVDNTDSHIFMIFKNYTSIKNYQLIDDFDQLLYLKTIYKHSLKHDKEKEKRNIETIEEIFVEDIGFVNTVDEEYSNSRGMPKESKYKDEYWKSCDCELYYTPNNKIFEVMDML